MEVNSDEQYRTDIGPNWPTRSGRFRKANGLLQACAHARFDAAEQRKNLFSHVPYEYLSLFKKVKIKERFNIELRAEAFNFTNTPQFANPSSSITSPTFGDVTSTVGSGTGVNGVGGGRAVELGVKFTF